LIATYLKGLVFRDCQVFEHMFTPFPIGSEIPFQEIRHEKDPDDGKDDEQFNQDDDPDTSSPGRQVPESIEIKPEYPVN
jgi:hypothetical protein